MAKLIKAWLLNSKQEYLDARLGAKMAKVDSNLIQEANDIEVVSETKKLTKLDPKVPKKPAAPIKGNNHLDKVENLQN